MGDNREDLEKELLETKKQKEESDRRLLAVEIAILLMALISFLTLCTIASKANMDDNIRILIITVAVIFLLAIGMVSIRIEQKAGYYKCAKCQHKYVPTYFNVLKAMHINRTRYMRCPKCNKRSWNKKVIN